jgi:hypothetical protein
MARQVSEASARCLHCSSTERGCPSRCLRAVVSDAMPIYRVYRHMSMLKWHLGG